MPFVVAFLNLNADWLVLSGFSGLYYKGIPVVAIESCFRCLGIEYTAENLELIKLMEQSAKEVLNKK